MVHEVQNVYLNNSVFIKKDNLLVYEIILVYNFCHCC